VKPGIRARALDFDNFDDLLKGWIPLTVTLNSLNRSMGLRDPYPFVLSEMVTLKLRFVHEVIEHANLSAQEQENAAKVLAPTIADAAKKREALDAEAASAAASGNADAKQQATRSLKQSA
jgi:hypothetical protein